MQVWYFRYCIFVIYVNAGLTLQLDDITFFKPAESYPIENTLQLQPSEQDVPLEEFFWTGSGDGPAYIGQKDSLGHDAKHQNTIIRTATILATVYVDGNYDSDSDPFCVYDCNKRHDDRSMIESIDQIPPSDRRYWLLTVVAGLFNPEDFPILEEKLAKLYRIAFLRQQAKHLGISNGNNSTVNRTKHEHNQRKKRFSDEKVIIAPTSTFNLSEKVRTRRFEINKYVYERQVLRMKRQGNDALHQGADISKSIKLKTSKNFMQKINVIIHNVVHGDEDKDFTDINKLNLPSDRSNLTEIIYSVIVGGKPVLASTAADDMRLVKLEEVAKIMENDIVLKAEPYLREPQATPLIPSYMSGSNVSTYITENPLLIGLTSIALILFILLIITLLLYGRSKRHFEAKQQNATQALVRKMNVDDDINTIRSDSLEEVGVDNMAFVKDEAGIKTKEPPVLHFPLPPTNRPSSSTSTSTSDSSVYYPKRRYKFNGIEDLLDGIDGKLLKKEKEDIYTKLHSSKPLKKDSKAHKQYRHRRKYRSDNRIGSLEQVDVHSFQSELEAYNEESPMPYQEHNEAFNLEVSHYNANKLMRDETFSINEVERKKSERNKTSKSRAQVEAINKELIQQHGNIKAADTNSIGSFLSMASIRSFPKCSMPEPLSRVLEPVSVTHLDHSDADYDTLKNYRMDSQKSLNLEELNDNLDARTQSDEADPGVVGPVVWEMHKKGLEVSTNSLNSPLRDPQLTRNRFEGLLEGAMKLYGSSSYSNCHSVMNQKDVDQVSHLPGFVKTREVRGKSAANIRLTTRTSGLLSRTDFNSVRPMTAGPDTHQSQNPVPSIHAWTSGSGSTLVRPLSAGIYHKPNLTSDDKTELERTRAMSASPIIDAIQKELKRITDDNI